MVTRADGPTTPPGAVCAIRRTEIRVPSLGPAREEPCSDRPRCERLRLRRHRGALSVGRRRPLHRDRLARPGRQATRPAPCRRLVRARVRRGPRQGLQRRGLALREPRTPRGRTGGRLLRARLRAPRLVRLRQPRVPRRGRAWGRHRRGSASGPIRAEGPRSIARRATPATSSAVATSARCSSLEAVTRRRTRRGLSSCCAARATTAGLRLPGARARIREGPRGRAGSRQGPRAVRALLRAPSQRRLLRPRPPAPRRPRRRGGSRLTERSRGNAVAGVEGF